MTTGVAGSRDGRPLLVVAPQVGGVGAGHFMRGLALAQAWNDRSGRAVFVTGALAAPLAELLERESIAHVEADGRAAVIRAVEHVALEGPISGLVVDGYDYGTPVERALRPLAAATLAFDDGNETGAHDVDLLTDPTPGLTATTYAAHAPGAELLLGPRYAALRRARPDAASTSASGSSGASGASGASGSSRRRFTLLAGGEPPTRVRAWFVAVADGLRAAGFVVGAPGLTDPRYDDLAIETRATEVAITAGGSTTLDLCRLGVPTLVVVIADNQAGLAAGLDAAGAVRPLGRLEAVAPEDAVAAAVALANDHDAGRRLACRGRALVDGRGAGRLAVALRAAALRLEPARPDDARLVWEWANDPETRAMSFETDEIAWADHERWFAAQRANPDARMFIAATAEGAPVGQVRFARDGAELVIGVSVAADQRSRGFAAPLIAAGVARARKELPRAPIVAYIRAENERSQRAFVDAGFVRQTERVGPHESAVFFAEDDA
ncbi:MAG TPA: bifunctional UDP-2,4-diacetamido-2,4,6-trideoxy-beta-L-altropyranose hydrolase/GNAT family N-acetyltransferase [Acidimicrobiia bacterium]|nr:bifunctional UDP-2,4-diacetamido-2,4,6-trideoxy-beta-L-altropyranose hydrolase/GNAT family N-acetyltransferase [Acidimicrobiia bacterium]